MTRLTLPAATRWMPARISVVPNGQNKVSKDLDDGFCVRPMHCPLIGNTLTVGMFSAVYL